MYQILIVDDREVVRKELRKVLELTGSVSVVGEAIDGMEAIHKAEVLKPEIVLMDLDMPGMDGIEATRQIKAMKLAPTVIILSVYADDSSQQKAYKAGADAFLVKGTALQTLLDFFERFTRQKYELPDKSEDV